MYSAEDILEAREKRVEKQRAILKKYSNTLVVVRANYPGINKDNTLTRELVNIIKDELIKVFNTEHLSNYKHIKSNEIKTIEKNMDSILFKELEFTPEGPIFFMVVNKNVLEAKKLCITVEETHLLGRFVDIDVYNENCQGISRRELNMPSRRCFICNEEAHLCVRSRRHSQEEIINFIETSFKKYKKDAHRINDNIKIYKEQCNYKDKVFTVSSMAVKAMLYEVSAFPKPGLVTPISTGAHKDMDYFTFIDSTCALMETMIKFSEVGFSSKGEKEIFNEARKIGKIGDKHMLESTNGVNTHKGMIFLMGISCMATTKAMYHGKSFNEIKNIIKAMTRGIVKEDLEEAIKEKHEDTLTYGELLYKNYGITGVRGEVEKGIPVVFNQGLKIYEENDELQENYRLVHTLIAIMSCCEDTNVIHRKNIEVLREIQNKAKDIMKIGGMKTENGRKAVEDLNKEFINRNISPGGCADLLAITVFFHNVKKLFESIN